MPFPALVPRFPLAFPTVFSSAAPALIRALAHRADTLFFSLHYMFPGPYAFKRTTDADRFPVPPSPGLTTPLLFTRFPSDTSFASAPSSSAIQYLHFSKPHHVSLLPTDGCPLDIPPVVPHAPTSFIPP